MEEQPPEALAAPDEAPRLPSELPLPDFIPAAPGLLGLMVKWMTATAISPQPLLSLGAALCAVGTAAGRRFRLEQPDTRSNVYIAALGDSGSGKDHPRAAALLALVEAGLSAHLGGDEIASGAGLLGSVTTHPVRLFQIDEFGHFVTAVLDPKFTPPTSARSWPS